MPVFSQLEIAAFSEWFIVPEKAEVIMEEIWLTNVAICSRCYDTSPSVDRKTVRLLISDHEITGSFYCPECKIHPRTKEGESATIY